MTSDTIDPDATGLAPTEPHVDRSSARDRAWRLALDLERALHGSLSGTPVHPAPLLVAEVAVRPAPDEVPFDLISYTRAAESAAGHDWQLTADAIAIGPRSVVHRFGAWRAGWVRSWDLDHGSNVRSLVARSRALGVEHVGALDAAVDGHEMELDRTTRRALIDAFDDARRLISSTDAQGLGFVDATPGSPSIGLRRTWSPVAGVELLAAGRRLGAWMHPVVGLCVGIDDHADDHAVLRGVSEVEFGGDHVRVTAGTGPDTRQIAVDPDTARPLAWLVPGAMRWRVRAIPEVVVWARTLVRLRDAAAFADATERPLTVRPASRFTAEWPDALRL
jgi:hypothetical protein